MPDFLTKQARSARMARVKAKGTRPESLLVEALRRVGIRPSTNVATIAGKPDVVFKRARLACFVDGELWHGGQWRRRGLRCLNEQFSESNNREYWLRKLNSNIIRDIRNTANLVRSGWSVVRFWASDVETNPDECAARLVRIVSEQEEPDAFSHASTATVADFFSGIGLMRLALKHAGWETVWANDYDPIKRLLYEHNLGTDEVSLDPRPIEKVGINQIPQVGLISACFPCTDLSLAGAVRGIEKGEQSSSFLRFATLLTRMRSKRPPFVILENVMGLIHSHEGLSWFTVNWKVRRSALARH